MNFNHKTKWISSVKIEISMDNTEFFHKSHGIIRKGISVQHLCNYCATSVQLLCYNCTYNAHLLHDNCTVNNTLIRVWHNDDEISGNLKYGMIIRFLNSIA